jgi:hypothetical protein
MQRALLFVFMRSMVLMGVMVYIGDYSWFEAYAAAVVPSTTACRWLFCEALLSKLGV